MLIVFAPDHAQTHSRDPVGAYFKPAPLTKAVVAAFFFKILNAQDSCEEPGAFYKELCCSPPSWLPPPAWQSNEVIDFLPRLGLIHIKPNTETIFYSADL